ncbi:MAG: rane protein of unknown function, partial [Ramlibacter sp.]|nr:rane protein of unknown function [Ramlibacter sp.]
MNRRRLLQRWRRELGRQLARASRGVLLWGWAGYVLLVAVFAVGAGLYLWQVDSTNRELLATRVAAAQDAAVARFEGWMDGRIRLVRAWAEAEDTQQLVRSLLAEPRPTPERLNANPLQAAFRDRFARVQGREGTVGYFIVSPAGISLGALGNDNAGTPNLLWQESEFVQQMKERGAAVSPFMTSDVHIESGITLDDQPITLFAGVPVYLDG